MAGRDVGHLIYLAVLVGCLLGTAPLEIVLHTRVYARPRRLILTLVPVAAVFVAWDLYAIARHQWHYDRARTTGVLLPGRLPLEELLFFLVVPVCAILTLEAVRAVKGWRVGDETDPADPADPGDSGDREAPPDGSAR
ncbi:MAG: lycopene cyclase domain-containing protein [Frankia sp.]